MTPIELYRKGFKALVDALGYADAMTDWRRCIVVKIFI
ncbi:hypothetical protein CAL7102_02803 [Dulcicalothrix desertica PCC 7102]|nr:hypothetical protein CAL7102_02803 [Dulcicalothrix desertica PCC 7102]